MASTLAAGSLQSGAQHGPQMAQRGSDREVRPRAAVLFCTSWLEEDLDVKALKHAAASTA
jgi:hypothetical protein